MSATDLDLEPNESRETAGKATLVEEQEFQVVELTWFVHLRRLSITFLLLPGILAAIGATTETIIYGNLNRPNFNNVYGVYAALMAIPFILIRWYWRWPKHVQKLELAYYALFTGGFVASIVLSTVAGQDAFRTGAHIRRLFDGPPNARHSEIATEEDIHNWLNATLGATFQDSRRSNPFSRELQGRLALLSPIRLSQFRSSVKPCSALVAQQLGGSGQCYKSRSETSEQDTQPFSSLNYSYSNPSYLSLPLKTVHASDISIQGEQYSYPLAGHWVLFGPDYSNEMVASMLAAMRSPDHPWIDHQTSMVSLDFYVVVVDSPKTLSAIVTYVIESTSSGWYVPTPPSLRMLNLDDLEAVAEGIGDDGEGRPMLPVGQCVPIPVHRNFFIPIYLGVLPAVIYTIFRHILQGHSQLSKYARQPFTYTELGWVLCILLAMIFRWRAISLEHCDNSVLEQEIYGTNETREVFLFEQVNIAEWWFESRRVLGMAIFLHLFTALKFVVQLPSLGGLIRTLQLAGLELASFSLSFAVVFVAFVSMFYVVFSNEVPQYQSIARCIGTLWLGMLGELEISPEMWKSKEWALPVVIIFTFISVFVLLTVIVAIISDAHEAARVEKEKALEAEQRMSEMLSSWRERRARSNGSEPGTGRMNRSQAFLRRMSFGSYGRSASNGRARSAGLAGVVNRAMTNPPVGCAQQEEDTISEEGATVLPAVTVTARSAGPAGVVNRAVTNPPVGCAQEEEDTISEEGATVLPAVTVTLARPGNGRHATNSTTNIPEASLQDSPKGSLSLGCGPQVQLLPPHSMADRKPPGSKFGALRGLYKDGRLQLHRKSKIKPLETTPGSRNGFAAAHALGPLKTFPSTTTAGEDAEVVVAERGSTSSGAIPLGLPNAATLQEDAV